MTEREQMQKVQVFMKDQSLGNLQKVKNAGLTVKRLIHGKWVEVDTYDLPEKVVPLYDDNLELEAVGFY